MLTESLDTLAQAAGGRVIHGRPDTAVQGHFSDTRAPVRGGMYIALRGERFDGNNYVREAVEKHGARAVLLDSPDAVKNLPPEAGAILVNDTRLGYLGIAAAHRRKHNGTLWIGITGSVGKSTTKEMLAHIFACATKWNIHKAQGSFNNAIGLSHTILGVTHDHQAAVLELGTNHFGEIHRLAEVARPNIAVITCAAESHLENLLTVENVAREKSDILAFQQPEDIAILNADSPYLHYWRSVAKGKVMTFGVSDDADVRRRYLEINRFGCVDFMVRHQESIAGCSLRVPGVHQVTNALAAISAALAAGVPLELSMRALETFDGVARRFKVHYLNGLTLVDDAYNANPASFTAALATLNALAMERKFVVAGNMLELGAQAEYYHRKLGRQLAGSGLSGLVTVGELARFAGDAAVNHGLPAECWRVCATPEEAAAYLKPLLRSGDSVLIKGSHGAHLDKCCEVLRGAVECGALAPL